MPWLWKLISFLFQLFFRLIFGDYLFSDEVGPESVFSGNKGFDEPSWGTFDTHYDAESVWGFDTDNSKVCEELLFYIAN